MKQQTKLVMIAGSAGSMSVILDVLASLKKESSIAMIILLHRKSSIHSALIKLLASRSALPVKEAEEKEKIKPGLIYVAPADYHLLIETDLSFSLDGSEKINFSRPSFDVSFQSAAEVFKTRLIGILLSGANADGVEGLKFIKHHRGTTIVQDPETAEVPYMPEQAILRAKPHHIMKTEEMAAYINRL